MTQGTNCPNCHEFTFYTFIMEDGREICFYCKHDPVPHLGQVS